MRALGRPVVAVLAVGAAALLAAGAAGALPTVVATQRDNPRGLTFGADGTLYVAEAGRGGAGPCFVNSADEEVCLGATGAITQVRHGTQTRIATGLPSVAGEGGGGAIGPIDVSVLGSRSASDRVLAVPGHTFLADAGGNARLDVSASGSVSTAAVFPNRLVPLPFPPFAPFSMDAVPTSVALGPDGAVCVGQSTGFPDGAPYVTVCSVCPGGGQVLRLDG